jgi:hypothetical protein
MCIFKKKIPYPYSQNHYCRSFLNEGQVRLGYRQESYLFNTLFCPMIRFETKSTLQIADYQRVFAFKMHHEFYNYSISETIHVKLALH